MDFESTEKGIPNPGSGLSSKFLFRRTGLIQFNGWGAVLNDQQWISPDSFHPSKMEFPKSFWAIETSLLFAAAAASTDCLYDYLNSLLLDACANSGLGDKLTKKRRTTSLWPLAKMRLTKHLLKAPHCPVDSTAPKILQLASRTHHYLCFFEFDWYYYLSLGVENTKMICPRIWRHLFH